ncbi:MAG: prolipoprotein diacylglyceryl transferase, partial [Coriobacteriia bacterium]
GAPVGFGLGRLANFANNELWGRTTGAAWGVIFPGAGAMPRHPSQLYEAFLEGIVMFAVLLWLARRRRPDGMLFGVFMVFYGVFRFGVEFFREPDAQLGFLWGGATMGQLLSVPLVLLGGYFVWRALRRADASDGAITRD